MNKEGGEEECRPHAQQEALKNLPASLHNRWGHFKICSFTLPWTVSHAYMKLRPPYVVYLEVKFCIRKKKRKRKRVCSVALCDSHLKPETGSRNKTAFLKTIQRVSKLCFFNLKTSICECFRERVTKKLTPTCRERERDLSN